MPPTTRTQDEALPLRRSEVARPPRGERSGSNSFPWTHHVTRRSSGRRHGRATDHASGCVVLCLRDLAAQRELRTSSCQSAL